MSLKYKMFKNLRYDRANGYSPEIVTGERFFAALIGLGDRHNIAISKSIWYIGAE